jgi:hypothetical protein
MIDSNSVSDVSGPSGGADALIKNMNWPRGTMIMRPFVGNGRGLVSAAPPKGSVELDGGRGTAYGRPRRLCLRPALLKHARECALRVRQAVEVVFEESVVGPLRWIRVPLAVITT